MDVECGELCPEAELAGGLGGGGSRDHRSGRKRTRCRRALKSPAKRRPDGVVTQTRGRDISRNRAWSAHHAVEIKGDLQRPVPGVSP